MEKDGVESFELDIFIQKFITQLTLANFPIFTLAMRESA